ncbi:hypothetical protein J5N97_009817 [Dioscorea zingiberensis]|uniref:Uncharacterized protein n=1 Tax=Dioscorea zingiberensis TaxID=325984 RepID=A0A9D5CZ11_9LILI|nr:hypothetical protein J5N97_009817 [Dioscorea zingiberensis]
MVGRLCTPAGYRRCSDRRRRFSAAAGKKLTVATPDHGWSTSEAPSCCQRRTPPLSPDKKQKSEVLCSSISAPLVVAESLTSNPQRSVYLIRQKKKEGALPSQRSSAIEPPEFPLHPSVAESSKPTPLPEKITKARNPARAVFSRNAPVVHHIAAKPRPAAEGMPKSISPPSGSLKSAPSLAKHLKLAHH